MGPAAERHLPDSRHSASGVGPPPRGLYLTLGRSVSGQHRPSTEPVFSRIGPKPPLRPRGRLISAWIRWATKGRDRERGGDVTYQAAGGRRVVV